MIRKIGLLIGVAACGALVTSCGGGNSSDPTPTPTSTETATPTPTPTSGTVDFDFAADFDSTAQNTSAIWAYFMPTGGAETFSDLARVNGTAAIEYFASPNTVEVAYPELADTVSFAEADLVTSSATQRNYVNGDEALTLEVPFQYILRTTYELANQSTTQDTVVGTLRSNRLAVFFTLSAADSDITSNLTYTGDPLIVGGEPGATAPDVLSAPQVTFTITPGTDDDIITGTINVFEDQGGTLVQVGSFEFEAELSASNNFSGTIEDTTYDLEGNFAGALAGPDREELIIVFAVANADDGREFYGNFIGG